MAYIHVLSNLTSALPQRANTHERRKLTLSVLARRRGLDPRRQPLICSRNGQWISQKQWRCVCAKRDDVVVFVVMSRDGGLRSVALLGVLIAAAIGAPFLLGGLGLVGAGGLFAAGSVGAGALTAITTAGLVMGGSYLLNVLLPVRPAGDLSQSQVQGASPTYAKTISAQNNIARLGAPIPVLYGRMRFIPDLAAAPWVEWADQHQTLNQIFLLTQGEMQIEKIELGLTDASSFEDISTQVVDPGGTVTLFPAQVFTSNQVTDITLTPPNDPSLLADKGQWSSAVTYAADDYVWDLSFGPARTYFKSLSSGNSNHPPDTSPTFWQLIGSSIGPSLYKGPFAACPPAQVAAVVGVDVSFPAGLYTLDTTTGNPLPLTAEFTFECQEIDDSGNALSNWTSLGTITADSSSGPLVGSPPSGTQFMGGGYQYVAQRTSPITISFRIAMPSNARWQIRATRLDSKNLTGTVGHDVAWVGLRGFMISNWPFGDCTVLAMQITNTSATSINSQSAHQIAVTGTRKLPFWNGSSWSAPTALRDIAWAVADMLRNTSYGGKVSDSQFDLAHLSTLAAVWGGRGDTFDYYAAQATTLWAALGLALRAGRAVAYHQSGVVCFHRDAAQTVPLMLFSAENIVKGTFSMNFILPSPEDETDSLQVNFLSEETWLDDKILLPKPGVGDPQSPSINQLDGVVQSTQAANEAAYMLAADQYRRVLVSFDTEMEGLIGSRGDLILIQHDMPRWGQSTRIFSWNSSTNTVTLWGRLDFGDFSGTWYAYIRDRKGRTSTPTQIIAVNDDDLTVRLASVPAYQGGPDLDMVGTRAEPLHIVVGKSDAVPRNAIFLGATPRGGKRVSITAVLEDSRVHVN